MFGQMLLAASLILAQPAEDLESQVRDLARQLGADTIEEREAAEKQLLELGLPILEHLPPPNQRMPAEMRQRIDRIRLQLQQQRAAASVDGTKVTLSMKDRPVGEALSALEKQSGNKIVARLPGADGMGDAEDQPKITLDVKDVPFWQALNQVLDQAQLTIDIFAMDDNGRPLQSVVVTPPLGAQAAKTPRTSYHGAFRFEPISITGRRGLADPAESGLEVLLETQWEPKLSPITMSFPRDSLQAFYNDGSQTRSSRHGSELLGARQAGARFPLHLELPPHKAKRIEKLTGHLKVLLPGRMETFRFGPLPGPGKFKEKKGEVTVMVDRVAKNADAWEIHLRLRFDDAAGALQSHLLDWVEDNPAWLEAPDGKKVPPGTYQPTQVGESEYGVAYLFPLTGDIQDYSFVYSTPAALVEKSIPFEIKNLDLP